MTPLAGATIVVQIPCSHCTGKGELCDETTSRLRPCGACQTLGMVQKHVPWEEFVAEVAGAVKGAKTK